LEWNKLIHKSSAPKQGLGAEQKQIDIPKCLPTFYCHICIFYIQKGERFTQHQIFVRKFGAELQQ
jgi:hypothetical protein